MTRQQRVIAGTSLTEKLCAPRIFAPFLVLLTALAAIWFKDYGFPTNDEGAMLTGAAELVRGGVFYRDIDAYPLPGAPYLLSFAMRILGEHLSTGRWLEAGLFCGIVWTLYCVSLMLLTRRQAALFALSLLSLKYFAWPAFTDYIYADVSLFFSTACILTFLRHHKGKGDKWLLAAGLLASGAVLSKQNLGVYLIGGCLVSLACFRSNTSSCTRNPRSPWFQAAIFGAGAAGPLLLVALYFAHHHLLSRMIYSGFVRPFTGYLPTSGISFSVPLQWWKLGTLDGFKAFPYFPGAYWESLLSYRIPWVSLYTYYWLLGEIFTRSVYTLFLVTLLGALFVCGWTFLARRRSAELKLLSTYGVLAVSVAVSAFPRADFYHIISVAPVVLLLLFCLLRLIASSVGRGAIMSALSWAQGVIVWLLVIGAGLLSVIHFSGYTYRMKLKKLDLYVSPWHSYIGSIVRAVDDQLGPDEPLFVYGHEAYYYFLTGRFSPWLFNQLYPGQAGGDGGMMVVSRLEAAKPRLIISIGVDWPGLPPLASYTGKLLDYIRDNYRYDATLFDRYPPAVGPPWPLCDMGRQAYLHHLRTTQRFSPWPYLTLFPEGPERVQGRRMVHPFDPLPSPLLRIRTTRWWRLIPIGRYDRPLEGNAPWNYETEPSLLELYPPYTGLPEPSCTIGLLTRRAFRHDVY